MKVISYETRFENKLVPLIAQNAIELAKLKDRQKEFDLEGAKEDLEYYIKKKFPIFLAVNYNDEIIGFTVCRIDEDVAWNQSLFVNPEERRGGVASALYRRAEQVAIELGSHTLYNWVHPNNEKSILFL